VFTASKNYIAGWFIGAIESRWRNYGHNPCRCIDPFRVRLLPIGSRSTADIARAIASTFPASFLPHLFYSQVP